jgi:hypothetical protein
MYMCMLYLTSRSVKESIHIRCLCILVKMVPALCYAAHRPLPSMPCVQ